MRPVFFYDVSSPYAYLAAARVDDVLPVKPEWRPIAFGVLVRRIGKVPWSFAENRMAHFSEIERRAAERGLPEVRYPDGWPAETYALTPLRALMLARDQMQLRSFSRELFKTMFVDGQHLADVDAVLDAAEHAGLDRDEVGEGVQRQEIKEKLRAQTDAAHEQGVTGIPTVAVGDRLFWGDDRLEEAASLLN